MNPPYPEAIDYVAEVSEDRLYWRASFTIRLITGIDRGLKCHASNVSV